MEPSPSSASQQSGGGVPHENESLVTRHVSQGAPPGKVQIAKRAPVTSRAVADAAQSGGSTPSTSSPTQPRPAPTAAAQPAAVSDGPSHAARYDAARQRIFDQTPEGASEDADPVNDPAALKPKAVPRHAVTTDEAHEYRRQRGDRGPRSDAYSSYPPSGPAGYGYGPMGYGGHAGMPPPDLRYATMSAGNHAHGGPPPGRGGRAHAPIVDYDAYAQQLPPQDMFRPPPPLGNAPYPVATDNYHPTGRGGRGGGRGGGGGGEYAPWMAPGGGGAAMDGPYGGGPYDMPMDYYASGLPPPGGRGLGAPPRRNRSYNISGYQQPSLQFPPHPYSGGGHVPPPSADPSEHYGYGGWPDHHYGFSDPAYGHYHHHHHHHQQQHPGDHSMMHSSHHRHHHHHHHHHQSSTMPHQSGGRGGRGPSPYHHQPSNLAPPNQAMMGMAAPQVPQLGVAPPQMMMMTGGPPPPVRHGGGSAPSMMPTTSVPPPPVAAAGGPRHFDSTPSALMAGITANGYLTGPPPPAHEVFPHLSAPHHQGMPPPGMDMSVPPSSHRAPRMAPPRGDGMGYHPHSPPAPHHHHLGDTDESLATPASMPPPTHGHMVDRTASPPSMATPPSMMQPGPTIDVRFPASANNGFMSVRVGGKGMPHAAFPDQPQPQHPTPAVQPVAQQQQLPVTATVSPGANVTVASQAGPSPLSLAMGSKKPKQNAEPSSPA